MNIEYEPDALLEAVEAVLFYHSRDGTGDRFNAVIDETMNRIRMAPLRWPILDKQVRRCLCPIYPYAILYTVEIDCILVIAVMHLHRDPDYWRYRIQ